jgi:hypothetical protein
MKNDWTEEATRVHQYGPSVTDSGAAAEREASYTQEPSTVIGNRESLMALVSASMTVEDSGPAGRAALPVSRSARPATAAGTIQSFPFGHDDGHTGADRTPPPIQTRQEPSLSEVRVSKTPRPSKKNRRLGPHLPITVGLVASFVLGLALRNEPAPNDVSPPPLTNVPAGPLIQPRTPPAASMPVKATLKITSSPAGAYVTVDGEVAPTATPREVPVKMGTWITLSARRPGYRPASRAVLVQEEITSVEIPLERLDPLRSNHR